MSSSESLSDMARLLKPDPLRLAHQLGQHPDQPLRIQVLSNPAARAR